MQKKVSKKVLSLLLAVLMAVCMLPMGGFAAMAQTSWVEFASSDFTQAKFNQSASAVSGVDANIYKATNVQTATSSDKAMSWNVGEWTDSLMIMLFQRKIQIISSKFQAIPLLI